MRVVGWARNQSLQTALAIGCAVITSRMIASNASRRIRFELKQETKAGCDAVFPDARFAACVDRNQLVTVIRSEAASRHMNSSKNMTLRKNTTLTPVICIK